MYKNTCYIKLSFKRYSNTPDEFGVKKTEDDVHNHEDLDEVKGEGEG